MKRRRSGAPILNAMLEETKKLPIRKKTSEILSALAANDVLIIVGETGSGKTTQLPQIIVDSDSTASIVVTQPRRVAAITVATRVAAERGADLGAEVGYAVRFDDKSERGVTTIRYVTDGVLLREALSEGSVGLKRRYSHVLIDEVHERSINTDLILGVIKQTLSTTNAKNAMPTNGFAAKNEMFAKMIRSKLPFKVVVMSATTDASKIAKFFQDGTSLSVSVLNIPGRIFPVKLMYACSPVSDYVDGSVMAAFQAHLAYPMNGDILVFLPGQEEILSAVAILKGKLKKAQQKKNKEQTHDRELRIFSLFAALSPEDQVRAIEPMPEDMRDKVRKVIFATNIAETSITIPNVVYVVDSGVVKVRKVMQSKGLFADVLGVQPVSKAQADQRKGRAGRTAPGILFRLYIEDEYKKMADFPQPEILRSDAAAAMLQIIALCATPGKNKRTPKPGQNGETKLGSSFNGFPLLDNIPRPFVAKALETLFLLGAVDIKMELTKTGRLMSQIPVPPMLARSLLESLRVGCVDSMITLAAVLSVEGGILLYPATKRDQAKAAHRRFLSICGDHLTLVNVLNAFLQLDGVSRRMEFCRDHFLNYRSLVSAESIRGQLDIILRHGDMVSWGLRTPLPGNIAADIEDASIDELVRRCLVAGFFRQTARKSSDSGRYIPFGTSGGSGKLMEKGVDIHPSSALRAWRVRRNPPFVIYHEFLRTTKHYLRTVVSIERSWLSQHCNDYFDKVETL